MPFAFPENLPALRIEGLRHAFASGHRLRVDHLALEAGRILAIAGLNGAGKSTLLRCVLDLCALDAGSVELYGMPHRDARARARSASLSDKFMPSYYLDGRDLLRYALALHGARYVEAEAREMCSGLDLHPDALDRPARTLSKGMTQKLGLAACFLSRKPLLLLDEPASGLDARGRAALTASMHAHRAQGGSVVFSSHHLDDAAALADRVCILHRGQVLDEAPAQELVRHHGGANAGQAILRCIDRADSVR